VQSLSSIVGAEYVRETNGLTIVSPATTEEVSAILKLCAEHNLSVTASGSCTKLGWGNAVTPKIQLDTTRISGLRDHSWQDLTATVGAGTTWSALQQHLSQHQQRVALDPLFPTRATVGGVLSTNDSGLLRMRYGGLRDLVIGMTIVLADGTIARTGGKVVKNVAGYDLPKLLTGSFGTLGIITEATFRLHPLQAHTSKFTIRSAEIAPLADLMHALITSAMSLEAMQLRNEPTAFALDVQFAAVPAALVDHEERLHKLAASLAVEPTATDIFITRENLFAIPDATILKLTTLSTKLSALIAGFAQLESTGITAQAIADPVGVVTVALVAPPAGIATILEDLRARLHAIGGTAIILQRGLLSADIDPWNDPQHPPPALDVMRAIKQEFDPTRLLNPGKFVGGL
jgi:glycolate oxidase FAD binding subunit